MVLKEFRTVKVIGRAGSWKGNRSTFVIKKLNFDSFSDDSFFERIKELCTSVSLFSYSLKLPPPPAPAKLQVSPRQGSLAMAPYIDLAQEKATSVSVRQISLAPASQKIPGFQQFVLKVEVVSSAQLMCLFLRMSTLEMDFYSVTSLNDSCRYEISG